jgi:cytosylglucuronate decarboxylase
MPAIQRLISKLGVQQWELSSLKLEKALVYSAQDQKDVNEVIEGVYVKGRENGLIVPFGKIWCGNTDEERQKYFETGITPSPDGQCHIVDKVRYLDARNGQLFTCSLIPHRPDAQEHASIFESFSRFAVDNESTRAQADFFRSHGPLRCTGCSSTAAGVSNDLATSPQCKLAWYY